VAITVAASPQAGSIYLTSLAETDETGDTCGTGAAGTAVFCQAQVITDTASTIRYRANQNAAVTITTHGYIDRRGAQ
jgi:hypothetical protein